MYQIMSKKFIFSMDAGFPLYYGLPLEMLTEQNQYLWAKLSSKIDQFLEVLKNIQNKNLIQNERTKFQKE